MKTLILAAAFSMFASSAFACVPPICGLFLGTDDVATGVLCKINDVTVIAANPEDCSKAGGSATHSITSTRTPLK